MARKASNEAILGPLVLEAKCLAKKKITSLNIIGFSNKKREQKEERSQQVGW